MPQPDLKALFNSLITRQELSELGEGALLTMRQRTQKGQFLEGSSPGAASYSTRPFARPAGGLTSAVFNALDDSADGSTFFTRAGAMWVVIAGGYARFRELSGRSSSTVDLNFSGQMMRDLQLVSIDPARQSIEIGFLNQESEQLARWHQIDGAGQSKTRRVFVGLSNKESGTLTETLEGKIAAKIDRFNRG